MNRSRRKGTAWESAIVDYLRRTGWPYAERRALAGNADRGDIAGVPGVVIEAKACRTLRLAEWLHQAEAERRNDGADLAAVWIKRVGRTSAADGYVVLSPDTFTRLLLDAGYGSAPTLAEAPEQ